MNHFRFETLALHAGQKVDESMSRAVPIHRTTSYLFKNTEHAANLFGLKELGNIYTRLMNPTQDVLEQRLSALTGGAAALALSSGTSAIFYSVINILSQGDELVAASNLYGGTYSQFHDILPQFGIKTVFADIHDLESFKKAINGKTRAVYIETIGNPALDVADIRAIADLAHAHELPLLVDATFTPPSLLNPFEHGADIVIHSLTKWIGGHGTGLGGVVIDSGKFNWKNPKFKLYNEPDSGYHGLRFAHDLGELSPIAFTLRMRLIPLRNLGAAISPDNAWLFLQGLETLTLRMERHSENALKVAQFLKNHPKVSWVRYPGLPDDPSHSVAKKYLKKGFGGMVVFGTHAGYEGGKKLIENLKLFSHLANVGDAKSLVLHPSSTSHSQLSEADQKVSGLTPDLVRLSVGIEHIDDILADLRQALDQI